MDYAHSLPHRELVIARAQQLSRFDDDPIALLRALRSDPLVVDAVLFEDGLLDRFLQARATLLPADERDLAAEWRRSHLRVYEVLSTRPGMLNWRALSSATGTSDAGTSPTSERVSSAALAELLEGRHDSARSGA